MSGVVLRSGILRRVAGLAAWGADGVHDGRSFVVRVSEVGTG
jgi:hypothetical protein